MFTSGGRLNCERTMTSILRVSSGFAFWAAVVLWALQPAARLSASRPAIRCIRSKGKVLFAQGYSRMSLSSGRIAGRKVARELKRRFAVGIAEGSIGTADVSNGAEVCQRKAIEILVFIAQVAKGEAAVADGEAAAVPVVAGLNAAVLQGVAHKVVAGVCGQVESARGGAANLQKGHDLLALDERRGGALFV